ncbi:MAG TPA: SDR family oxidoreductase [Acidimicrobiales bacterium]|nr:SDR family oxidoreductase [Acidimicrobiales bacterium]
MLALVTGGAGFIGSNIVDRLVARGDSVRVLDDLTTGYRENVPAEAELVEAHVADAEAVERAMAGVEVVFHQAAHRSVFRSVEHPLETDTANTHGTLTVLHAALRAGVRRVVYASSSSVYGGADVLPTTESVPTHPRSPYAVTKLAGELYGRVFAETYGLETASLRYFNVFGPRQRPDSAYAAVIPLFIAALREGTPPEIHGDGLQSRDFTFIEDVVGANLAAAAAPSEACRGQAYNIAQGGRHSLMDLLDILGRLLDARVEPHHVDPRPGDVRHSQADITAATTALGWTPAVAFEDGLERTVAWFTAR